MSSSANGSAGTTVDILAATFFVIAGAWLLLALAYSMLVLVFLRLRARGELDLMYRADFGRVYLCGCSLWRTCGTCANVRNRDSSSLSHGPRCCYIPLGWIFRRYMEYLVQEQNRTSQSTARRNTHFMTTPERRAAMATLLKHDTESDKDMEAPTSTTTPTTQSSSNAAPSPKRQAAAAAAAAAVAGNHESFPGASSMPDIDVDVETARQVDDAGSYQGPVCSICLAEFEDPTRDSTNTNSNRSKEQQQQLTGNAYLVVLKSNTCTHEFHQGCILDWLQRPGNTECPCCREPMVQEEAVYRTVLAMRKAQKRAQQQHRQQQQQQRQHNSVSSSPSSSNSSSSTSTGGNNKQQRSMDSGPESANNNDVTETELPSESSDDNDFCL